MDQAGKDEDYGDSTRWIGSLSSWIGRIVQGRQHRQSHCCHQRQGQRQVVDSLLLTFSLPHDLGSFDFASLSPLFLFCRVPLLGMNRCVATMLCLAWQCREFIRDQGTKVKLRRRRYSIADYLFRRFERERDTDESKTVKNDGNRSFGAARRRSHSTSLPPILQLQSFRPLLPQRATLDRIVSFAAGLEGLVCCLESASSCAALLRRHLSARMDRRRVDRYVSFSCCIDHTLGRGTRPASTKKKKKRVSKDGVTDRPMLAALPVLLGNVSQVDRLWTFLPMAYSIHFTFFPKWSGTGEVDERMLLLLGLQALWSIRLTTNTYRRGFFNP